MIIVSQHTATDLEHILQSMSYDRIFVLSDEHTQQQCVSILKDIPALQDAVQMVVKPGESAKSLDTAVHLWKQLNEESATRHSLMLSVGGGMITDLGGFVAAAFKRGMQCVHVSTTLLGAVDAATGGKTAVNFEGYKNLIGFFHEPQHVIVATDFFATLDTHQLLSGYAEMLKHALISSRDDWQKTIAWDTETMPIDQLCLLLKRNIAIKQRIVEDDPTEQGKRKTLNFGHTIGHAIESWTHTTNQPQPHGYAVLWGMVAELFLSHKKLGFPLLHLQQLITLMKQAYGRPTFTCNDYNNLHRFMLHDKKNLDAKHINFTLLKEIGIPEINQTASIEEIDEALDFLREG